MQRGSSRGSGRFCRWLLQSADRAESNTVDLTQEFLSEMLGVRRTSVSDVASHIQKMGCIHEDAAGVAQGVALDRHHVGLLGGARDSLQRQGQVSDAIRLRMGGIVRKDVEQPPSYLSLGVGQSLATFVFQNGQNSSRALFASSTKVA
jgi:hypothetical protein